MEMMLERLLGERVDLEVSAAEDLFPVLTDSGHIEQIMMNLAVNARDAMPNGGKLTIEAANVHLAGEYTSVHLGVADGDYVMLAVSDTGSGMDRETQARIFEPFFTTKDKGKGTGLGLSTVYGIVKQSKGHIWVYSEPGEGTSFKVYLPRAPSDVRPTRVRAPVLARFSGSETILLVEDDVQVRKVARGILRRNGYDVIEVSGAGEALRFAEDPEKIIDLLLTDVIMPEMGGMKLIERLTAARPEMRVICMSGYTGDAAIRHGIAESRVAFVQKPLTPETLLMEVRAELDRHPQSGVRERVGSTGASALPTDRVCAGE
jgi:CheY-like chemotaxis protein